MTDRTFEMALRQCRQSLQRCNIPHASHPTRAFSTTPSRWKQGALPTFSPTPIPELSTLLTTLRSNIFLPTYLRLAQRKLIFRTRHHAMLLSEPLFIDLSSERIQLLPIDQTKDIPDSWSSVVRAMSLMGTSTEAWSNLPVLLVGMRTAGRKWKDWQWEYIVRTAGEKGQARWIVESVRQARKTGLILQDLRLVREVMWACRSRALLSGWDKEETKAALRCAVQASLLMEDKVHLGGPVTLKSEDPRMQQDVMGVILELAAVRATRHLKGKDAEGDVLRYAARLVPNLRRTLDGVILSEGEGLLAARADYELCRWIPVREGLRLAEKVLGEQMPRAVKGVAKRKIEELNSKCEDWNGVVNSAQDVAQEKRRGVRWLVEASTNAQA